MKKNIMFLIIGCLCLTGCSLIPKINFDTPNTVPQHKETNKSKDVCRGAATFSDSGVMTSCTKGFYSKSLFTVKQERKMTIVERIKSFINNLMGWGFWGFVLLLFLCPSLIGVIFGRLIEGTMGIAKQTLNSVVRAVQKTRKEGTNLNESLGDKLDKKEKEFIKKVKDKENIK